MLFGILAFAFAGFDMSTSNGCASATHFLWKSMYVIDTIFFALAVITKPLTVLAIAFWHMCFKEESLKSQFKKMWSDYDKRFNEKSIFMQIVSQLWWLSVLGCFIQCLTFTYTIIFSPSVCAASEIMHIWFPEGVLELKAFLDNWFVPFCQSVGLDFIPKNYINLTDSQKIYVCKSFCIVDRYIWLNFYSLVVLAGMCVHQWNKPKQWLSTITNVIYGVTLFIYTAYHIGFIIGILQLFPASIALAEMFYALHFVLIVPIVLVLLTWSIYKIWKYLKNKYRF